MRHTGPLKWNAIARPSTFGSGGVRRGLELVSGSSAWVGAKGVMLGCSITRGWEAEFQKTVDAWLGMAWYVGRLRG